MIRNKKIAIPEEKLHSGDECFDLSKDSVLVRFLVQKDLLEHFLKFRSLSKEM